MMTSPTGEDSLLLQFLRVVESRSVQVRRIPHSPSDAVASGLMRNSQQTWSNINAPFRQNSGHHRRNEFLAHALYKTLDPTDCDPCAVTGPRAGEVPPRKLLAAGHATSPQERATHLSPMKTHIGRESDGEMTYLRDSGTQIIHFVTFTVPSLHPLFPLPSPLIRRYQG